MKFIRYVIKKKGAKEMTSTSASIIVLFFLLLGLMVAVITLGLLVYKYSTIQGRLHEAKTLLRRGKELAYQGRLSEGEVMVRQAQSSLLEIQKEVKIF